MKDNMRNIRIEFKTPIYIIVRADTNRFGDNAIMYEGNTFRGCFDYIERETGLDSLILTGTIASRVTDWKGETYPSYMRVEL